MKSAKKTSKARTSSKSLKASKRTSAASALLPSHTIKKRRPTKKELEEVTQQFLAQYKTAIKNLAKR